MSKHRLFTLIVCLSLALALGACRRGNAGPVSQPTLSPTPRSTSLPPIDTPVAVGSADNAVRMVFVLRDSVRSERAIDEAMDELEAALLEESGLSVQVERMETDAQAVAALCGSLDGTVTVAWLNGIAYSAAHAQNCGESALQAERGGSTTERAILVANADSGIASVADLANANFCRVSAADFYSWLMPSILMALEAFDPAELRTITDYEDVPALLDAVAAGDCDAAGVSERDFETLSNREVIALAGGVEVPISVLTYPGAFPLGQRQQLTDALIAIGNGSRAALLEPLLDQDAIVEVDTGDLNAIRSVLTRAGVDLAAIDG